jgi:hypothetical protein
MFFLSLSSASNFSSAEQLHILPTNVLEYDPKLKLQISQQLKYRENSIHTRKMLPRQVPD